MIDVIRVRSPKGSSGEPVRFTSLVGWQVADVVFSGFVYEKHHHCERNRRHSEVSEDSVSEAKTLTEGYEVS